MKLLPKWSITDKWPAVYDSESATAIEMTAKLYAAMQEMIKEDNSYADEVNKIIEEFINSSNTNFEELKNCIKTAMDNHIQCIDTKMDKQDKKIADAVQYMKDNIYSVTFETIETMFKNGDISFSYNYDAENEALNISIDYGVTE